MTKPEHLETPALLTRSSSGKLPYATQESLHRVAAICGGTEGVDARRKPTHLFQQQGRLNAGIVVPIALLALRHATENFCQIRTSSELGTDEAIACWESFTCAHAVKV
jgi:hypothetical protein